MLINCTHLAGHRSLMPNTRPFISRFRKTSKEKGFLNHIWTCSGYFDYMMKTTVYDTISILFYPETLEGCRGTRYKNTSPPCPVFSCPAELAKSIPVHSLILYSNFFFCMSLLFSTLPYRIVFAKSKDL